MFDFREYEGLFFVVSKEQTLQNLVLKRSSFDRDWRCREDWFEIRSRNCHHRGMLLKFNLKRCF